MLCEPELLIWQADEPDSLFTQYSDIKKNRRNDAKLTFSIVKYYTAENYI